MNQRKVIRCLRGLNCMVRRYTHSFAGRREVERLTGNNGWIIGYLADNDGIDIYQKTIEEHFMIARSTTSRILSSLEADGFIIRRSVDSDARLKKIELTDKSRAIREMMYMDIDSLERALLEGFSGRETYELVGYLDRMMENITRAHEQMQI
ncbi:MarR family winged helix-turn-helix transcriptional regulator [Parasphaerochaeta coccoides]|uniref:Regulatory protein MarR n=1 Tax=Parasphaerochaeta coccoides (strain ATCC BAA-1237 / DSM 17374 / SPN1) TaxID=760011 RepID=F4GIV7_PARC1|nr:MarR family transcriptional regulator [Parasphaerochaeta coccoides]AEC02725.1 regulatory protein MarR [Parasphaerochaeta coccoides DSM 17374]